MPISSRSTDSYNWHRVQDIQFPSGQQQQALQMPIYHRGFELSTKHFTLLLFPVSKSLPQAGISRGMFVQEDRRFHGKLCEKMYLGFLY